MNVCETLYVISDLGSIRGIDNYNISGNENIIVRINLTSHLYEVHIWDKDKGDWIAEEIAFKTIDETIMYGLNLL